MAELKELARSGGIEVVGCVIQQREMVDHRFLIGRGKLQDLTIHACRRRPHHHLRPRAEPVQIRSITAQTD